MEIESVFGHVISAYTRGQAMADGVLIDVSALAKKSGFKVPVVVTQGVWVDVLSLQGDVSEEKRVRYAEWNTLDILSALLEGIRLMKKEGPTVFFNVALIVRKNGVKESQWISLKSVISGGDNGEPVITIMLPEED